MINVPNVRKRRSVRLSAATLAIAAIAACGSDDPNAGGNTEGVDPGNTSDAQVVIEDFAFEPTPVELDAGAELTVSNRDQATHTLTADNDEFDTGNIAGTESTSLTIDVEPGRYSYHCEIHPSMNGEIEVN